MVAAGSPGGMAVAEYNREKHRHYVYVYLNNVLIHTFDSLYEG
jgi:hypothetical protein